MNLLYVSDSPTLSGAEVVMLGHVRALGPPVFRTHVYLRASNSRLQQALDEVGVSWTATTAFSQKVVRTTADVRDLAHFWRAFRRVTDELSTLIEARRIELLHSISYPASLYSAFACRRTGIRQIWHEHNVKRLHRFNRPIYRFVASTCQRVIGPSNAVIKALSKAGFDLRLLETVYNGIPLQRFSPSAAEVAVTRADLGLTTGQPAVGLFGQMLPHKGHEVLIAAAGPILRRFPDTRFFLVGALENPPYQQRLMRLLADGGVADRFTFTGWRQDVASLLGAMSLVVVPTLTPEPAALTLMEAMAVGRPVVGTRTGGTAELIEDGQAGLLIAPGDAQALAQATIQILSDPTLGQRLGEEGRRRVERLFSLDRHLERMRSLYLDSSSTHVMESRDGLDSVRTVP